MFIACPSGGEPQEASVPAARSATPTAPATDSQSGRSQSNRTRSNQLRRQARNGSNSDQGLRDISENSSSTKATSAVESRGFRGSNVVPAEVIAAAAASNDRALRGELSSVTSELQIASSALAESKLAARYANNSLPLLLLRKACN